MKRKLEPAPPAGAMPPGLGSPVGAPADIASYFSTPLPNPWYASPRNDDDRLDSTPLLVMVTLGTPTRQALERVLLRTVPTVGALRASLLGVIAGVVVRFDGEVVLEFSEPEGTMVPVPPLEMAFDDVTQWHLWRTSEVPRSPNTLTLRIGRKLPLSSSVGNAPLVRVWGV
jgi:hypothetical protein